MQLSAQLLRDSSSILPSRCQVEKVVELSSEDFDAFLSAQWADRPFLAENRVLMREENGVHHCLLVLGQDRSDGILAQAEEHILPGCAYLFGGRTVLNAMLEQAADSIVREGVENTSEGNWCVYFDELYERMGLVVTPDNGIGPMLLDTLQRRPEIAEVELTDTCFDAVYYLDYCKNLSAQPEETAAERQQQLINELMNYLGEHNDSSELYRMLHGDLEMTHEEIESLGFDLSDCYEEEPGLNGMEGVSCPG